MKPKLGDLLGDYIGDGPVEDGEMEENSMEPDIEGFYLQFPEEPLYAAIAAHDDETFASIQECKDFVEESEEAGRTFNVVDIDGKILYSGILTHDGVSEVKSEDLE